MIQKVLTGRENKYGGGKLGRTKEDKDVKKGPRERFMTFLKLLKLGNKDDRNDPDNN